MRVLLQYISRVHSFWHLLLFLYTILFFITFTIILLLFLYTILYNNRPVSHTQYTKILQTRKLLLILDSYTMYCILHTRVAKHDLVLTNSSIILSTVSKKLQAQKTY